MVSFVIHSQFQILLQGYFYSATVLSCRLSFHAGRFLLILARSAGAKDEGNCCRSWALRLETLQQGRTSTVNISAAVLQEYPREYAVERPRLKGLWEGHAWRGRPPNSADRP